MSDPSPDTYVSDPSPDTYDDMRQLIGALTERKAIHEKRIEAAEERALAAAAEVNSCVKQIRGLKAVLKAADQPWEIAEPESETE